MLYLICYDISVTDPQGPKRLRRIAKLLERHGRRIQRSVFEVRTSDTAFLFLRLQLLSIIRPKRDSIVIYPLAESAQPLESLDPIIATPRPVTPRAAQDPAAAGAKPRRPRLVEYHGTSPTMGKKPRVII